MTAVHVTIPGRIGGKGRGRATVSKRTGRVFVYTPEKTRNAEAMIRTLAAEAMRLQPPFQGPLFLKIYITLNMPQSWSKKKKAAAFYVTGKPDISNILKLVEDSLNGIVWHDDSQVCSVHFHRRYDDASAESVEVIVTQAHSEPVALRLAG